MTVYLRQSTASQEVPLGHFVDDTDGKTAETALTIANTDIKVWKTGATTLANKNSGGATHISGGIYYAVLDATDTDTVGPLVLFVAVSGALAVRLECDVLPANVFDARYGSDLLQVDIAQFGNSNGTFSSGRPEVNTTHAAGTAWGSGAITAASIATDAITAAKIAADAIGASELAADAVAEIQSGLSTLTQANIRTAVGLATANLDTQLTAIDDYVDTEVAAIKAQTDKLTFDGDNHIVADARKISTSSSAADNLEAGALGIVVGTCSTGSTTTSIVTNLTEATDDHYNGRVIIFTSGALAGQASDITDYNGTTKAITCTALTEAPANSDAFVIV